MPASSSAHHQHQPDELVKLRKANQEVIKQNMHLQTQLRKQNCLYQECLRENVELRRQLVELKKENDSINRVLTSLKTSVAERVPTLRLINEHLQTLTQMFELIGKPDLVEEESLRIKVSTVDTSGRPRRSSVAPSKKNLYAIDEEEQFEIYQD